MDEIHDWLLDSDPAIRWQVMRDLMESAESDVTAERARVAQEGWGERLLSLQAEDGNWGGGSYSPKWISTTYTLRLLKHFGVARTDPKVEAAIEQVDEKVDLWGTPFFSYCGERCVSAMVLALGSYFLDDPGDLPQPEALLETQLDDGGWNCDEASDRSSFNTTISAVEGLAEYERAVGGDADIASARRRAHEYLLERRLMYSLSTGDLINKRWLLFSFPPRWFYDVLRALDYLRLGADPDPRCSEAIELLRSKRRKDGSWPVQNRHSGREHFTMEQAGKPSRWNTLRALRVLDWYG